MKAAARITLVLVTAGIAVATPASAAEPVVHERVIEHASGAVPTTWVGTPVVTARQVGSPGAAGRPASLRCIWRVDLEIVRTARMTSGTSLNSTIRSANVFQTVRPGWCASERSAFAGKAAARDGALQARLRDHATQDTKAVMAQADAMVRATSATG
ncbi:hypothetical protein NSDW_11070 [Novosphingobium olei]|nr:hypothetical protein NSDW_11070 [Novosphingobium olei]